MRIDLTLACTVVTTVAKTILLTNDDGWASTNIRAAYRDLTAAGYDVVLAAPVSQRSGWGGRFDVPLTKDLLTDGEFGYVKAGAPSWGHEDNDSNIWYFNGTPSSCVSFALDYLLPNFYDNKTIDLVVSGPNEGPNLSLGYYTVSGTQSAAYYAIYRGIPAIAFSGSTLNNSFFKDSLSNDSSEPSNVYSKKLVELVDLVLNSTYTIPSETGLVVTFPQNTTCVDPTWDLSRLNGDGFFAPSITYNESTGLLELVQITYFTEEGYNCTKGDCNLQSDYEIYLANKCVTSVSVISVDYGATFDTIQSIKKVLGNEF